MHVLAWRTEYKTTSGARVVEWFTATPYGIGQFQIRQIGGMRPTIATLSQIKEPGWLKRDGMNAVSRHLWLRKMMKRAEDAGVRVAPVHQPDIETLNKTWLLDQLFQNDARASNAWSNLTGIPVGQSFEQIAAAAETQVAQEREANRQEKIAILSEIDPSWGMF